MSSQRRFRNEVEFLHLRVTGRLLRTVFIAETNKKAEFTPGIHQGSVNMRTIIIVAAHTMRQAAEQRSHHAHRMPAGSGETFGSTCLPEVSAFR